MTVVRAAQAIEQGLAHHRAGRLDEAAAVYERVLAAEAANPDALHLLGVIAHQRGDHQRAGALIEKAIVARPRVAAFHNNLANTLLSLDRLEDALAACRRAIGLDPESSGAHNNLGTVLGALGRRDEAVAAHERAIELKPDDAEAHFNLGNALQAREDYGAAAAAYRRAIEVAPDYAGAWMNLGLALKEHGQAADAVLAFQRAVEIDPGFAEAHNQRGLALKSDGRVDEAIAAFERAAALDPDPAPALNNLAAAHKERGDWAAAVEPLRRVAELQPDAAPARCNLGAALYYTGAMGAALEQFEHALAVEPDDPEAHTYRGIIELTRGELVAGFRDYQWRWRAPAWPSPPRDLPQPLWDGSDQPGKTILLHGEQGAGDTIQFLRYAPLVRTRVGRVVFECQAPLVRLLAGAAGVDAMVTRGGDLPAFDLRAPLLDLPGLLGATLDTIAGGVPYLAADPGTVASWRERLGGAGLKVGLVWRGRAEHINDHNRSIALDRLRPLLDVDGARFFALQVREGAGEVAAAGLGGRIGDLGPEISDFTDTAAILAALDLLVSVDTGSAHLAGALGRPVWLLLPLVPDWRWMLEREDSPWYPTMRLFRQPEAGDWDAVIGRVRGELAALAGGDDARLEPPPWSGPPATEISRG